MTEPATAPTDDNADQGATPTTPATPTDFETQRLASENRKHRLQIKAQADELEKLKQAAATETEAAVMKARAEGESTYKTRWRDALVANAALGRLAAKGITATELAVKALELADVDVDLDTGRVDSATLDARIDDLVTRYPVLAASGPVDTRPAPSAANASGQRQISAEEVLSADTNRRNELIRMALRGGQ